MSTEKFPDYHKLNFICLFFLRANRFYKIIFVDHNQVLLSTTVYKFGILHLFQENFVGRIWSSPFNTQLSPLTRTYFVYWSIIWKFTTTNVRRNQPQNECFLVFLQFGRQISYNLFHYFDVTNLVFQNSLLLQCSLFEVQIF